LNYTIIKCDELYNYNDLKIPRSCVILVVILNARDFVNLNWIFVL